MFAVLRSKLRKVFAVLIIVIILSSYVCLLKYVKARRRSLMISKIFSDMNGTWHNEASTMHHISTINLQESRKLLLNQKNIFFVETSIFSDNGTVLTPRKACAVESAAKMNPEFNVYLLILRPFDYLTSESTKLMVSQLNKYKNVFFGRIIMDDYVKDTPLEDWWNVDIIKSSYWPESHLSDILRYLILWKYGGIYLDLDFVIMKPLEHLKNFAGAEDSNYVASGVLGFTSELGRKISGECLDRLKKNFRGDVWNQNGPLIITQTLQNLCQTKNTEEMTVEKCQGFNVFPPSAFYLINWKYWQKFFTIENSEEVMKEISKSIGIHVWNHYSINEIIKVGSKVPYEVIANEYCPEVYKNCGKTF